jgi:hypothetical protein
VNKHIARTIAASLIAGTFGLAAWGGSARAPRPSKHSPGRPRCNACHAKLLAFRKLGLGDGRR